MQSQMPTPTKKFTFYKIWLWFSVIAYAITVLAHVAYLISAPPNCSACGLAYLGVVPFLLLSVLLIFINVFLVPAQLIHYKGSMMPALKRLSWFVFLIIPVLGVVIMMLASALLGER